MLDEADAVADTTRRQILFAIRRGPKSVNEIVEETGLKQPNVSNHLARLRNRKIVSRRKQGRQIFYTLASSQIDSILQAMVLVRSGTSNSPDATDLIETYVDRAVCGDEEAALEILEQAFRTHMQLLEIYEGLLAPAMRMVGEKYETGEIDEAQEHMASEITMRCMARTMHIAGPARRNGKRCVIGCVPNDFHVIGPRMAADMLRLNGWRTMFCGANVPIRSFLTAVHQNRPDLALVSCTNGESREFAVQLVQALALLRNAPDGFVIGVGGKCAAEIAAELKAAGADFVISHLRTFAQSIIPALETGRGPFPDPVPMQERVSA